MAVAFVLSRYAGATVAKYTLPASDPAGAAATAPPPPIAVRSPPSAAPAGVPRPPLAPSTAAMADRCKRQYGMYAPYETIPDIATPLLLVAANPTGRALRERKASAVEGVLAGGVIGDVDDLRDRGDLLADHRLHALHHRHAAHRAPVTAPAHREGHAVVVVGRG